MAYLPPGIPALQTTDLMETLTDTISESIAKADNPWLIVGGAFNRYVTSSIPLNVPELKKVDTGPTRGDAVLDYSFTNFGELIQHVHACFPIESNTHMSDHKSVSYEALLTHPAAFAWETSE